MLNKNKLVRIFTLVSAVVLLRVSIQAQVAAQEDDPLDLDVEKARDDTGERVAIAGGPGHIMLSAYEFRPIDPQTSWAYGSGVELYNPSSTVGYYIAPVNLPDHASITQIVFYWWDGAPAEDICLGLNAPEAGTYNVQLVAIICSVGIDGPGVTVYTLPTPELVDLSDTAYYFYLTIPGGYSCGLTLMEVRVDFNYPAYVPLVSK